MARRIVTGKKPIAVTQSVRMHPPVPPKSSPIPPGDHPPIQTKEEREAWAKFFLDHNEYLASLFNLQHLQEIVTKAGAPILADTFNAQAIVRTVGGWIANRHLPPNTLVEQIQKQMRQRKKEWGAIRKYVEAQVQHQVLQRQWFAERPWYGVDALTSRDDYIGKLNTFAEAMDEIEPWLFISRKARGQHGGVGIPDPAGAAEIFTRLTWAWQNSGVISEVSKKKRYEIVGECLRAARVGGVFTVDALGRAIEKHLRLYPFHAENPEGNGS